MSQAYIHHHRHPGYSYSVRRRQLWYGLVGVPMAAVVAAIFILHPTTTYGTISLGEILGALLASVLRLTFSFIISLVLAVPLALLIVRSPTTERILLPAFDILQSIPVLAFFPVVIIFFSKFVYLPEGASIFIILMGMVWSIVFSLVGGLRLIPADIRLASKAYHLSRTTYLRYVLVPSVVPYLITGSLLAWAEGWNILVVAEVLHTYVPGATEKSDLFGIGSVMVHASASGQTLSFVAAIIAMIVAIAIMNLLVWQRLLHFSERYRFE